MDILSEVRFIEFMISIIMIINISYILYKLVEDDNGKKNKKVSHRRKLYNIDLREDALWENEKD